jgi:hypothetical protein
MLPRRLVLAAVLAPLALAGCATPSPKVRADAAPDFQIGRYATYGFVPSVSYDRAGYSSITSSFVKAAVSRELEARGLTSAVEPDLLVNYDIETRDTLKQGGGGVRPSVGASYGSWGGLSTGIGLSAGGGVRTVKEGTLTIDLVDRARNQLVWSGNISGELSKEVLEHPQAAIDSATRQIFAQLPAARSLGQ